ncbi:MAG: hypothetical protein ACRDGT_01435 [Candidatus Limnocylindria bacterium]
MSPRIALCVVLVLALAAPAVAQESSGVSICGEIKAFTAATQTTDGSVTIGSRTIVLKADELYSQMGQNVATLAVPNGICLNASLNDAGEAMQYIAIPIPAPYCGTVLAFTAPTASTDGSVTLREVGVAVFRIPSGANVGAITTGSRPCLILRLDAEGNAIAAERSTTLAERAAASIHLCGLVTAWTEPASVAGRATLRHEEPGSITVAGRALPIAAGTEYSLVNSPPIVGEPTCLSGWLDAAGVLIQYAAQPGIPGCVGGRIARFEGPTETADGLVQFASSATPPATSESSLFPIPAGTSLPSDVANGTYCLELSLDGEGRAVVTGARIPEPGGPAAGTGPGLAPRQLPSTSTR